MKGIIMNYRRGSNTQTTNQMIIMPEDSKKSKELVGKKVVYKIKTGQINGVVTALHGRSGAVRARFERGLPGQSITKEVIFE
ncbi:MAG: 50S ribosomal protein L35ae [Candidatus Nanoarchaeia archaeon]|nr:50S ribosomal protein L35ae [Candidatus Nanoarchaeia archaeon]